MNNNTRINISSDGKVNIQGCGNGGGGNGGWGKGESVQQALVKHRHRKKLVPRDLVSCLAAV